MKRVKKTYLLVTIMAAVSVSAFSTKAYAKEATDTSSDALLYVEEEQVESYNPTQGYPNIDVDLEDTDYVPDSGEELSSEENSGSSSTYKTKLLTISKNSFVADTFQGVSALYRPGKSDGSSATYSCAAFIKRYYQAVYKIGVNNLFYKRTPNAIGPDQFLKVSSPQIGDIAAENSDHGTTHWAIVKAVNNGTVTLIEQNWKWQQGGETVTKINRTVRNSAVTFYRLKSENDKITKYSKK